MAKICGNVSTYDMSVSWANYKKSMYRSNVSRSPNEDMRNLWLKIKDWFTGQNSNDIVQDLITSRQCVEDYINQEGGEELLSNCQHSFYALYKTISQNLRDNVRCHISEVMTSNVDFLSDKTLFALTLPDNTVLGYTLFSNDEAQILKNIDTFCKQNNVDESQSNTIFCTTAELLTQARILQSTDITTCTLELISSFQWDCLHFLQNMCAAGIHSGLSCVYNPIEYYNGRFGRITMRFNDTIIMDFGLRCGDTNSKFVLDNTEINDGSGFFLNLRNYANQMLESGRFDLALFFRFQQMENVGVCLPAAGANSCRLLIGSFWERGRYDMLNEHINNTVFVLALISMNDRLFSGGRPPYAGNPEEQSDLTYRISELLLKMDIAEYLASNWHVVNNSKYVIPSLGLSGALPPQENIYTLVQSEVDKLDLTVEDILCLKQDFEFSIHEAALQRLEQLDNSGALRKKYQNYPIEGVLLVDATPWVLFQMARVSELKYMCMCLKVASCLMSGAAKKGDASN
ncbi:hypothetical protein RCN48_13875 [Escherichia marmotae]|nr:hypothetical protein [Escherichia marmotae]MED9359004.1 hypothetical protein [Escherichia marmotae]